MSSPWLNVALGQESASLTPLAAVGRAAVLEAGSATRDSAVDHANRENFSYILLPAFDTLAVFGAGSATHDTAGDMASEGDDEQPSTVYLIDFENSTASTALQEGSKDGKLNPTQFAPMKEVIDRDARVPPPSTAAASTDQVTPPGTQRQIAQALPGNLGKLNRAKRDSERRKTPRAKAAFAVRTSSAAYKSAKKKWNSKYRATAKAKTAAAGRISSAAYKSAKKISDSKRRATAKTKAAKQVSDSHSGQPISDAPGPFA